MRHTDQRPAPRWNAWLLRAAAPALLLVGSSSASADKAYDLCLDQRVRQAAAESVGKWAQYYPFSRVIIGNDGRFGYVTEPRVWQTGDDYVICLASYRLVRSAATGRAYTVSIDHFAYRITQRGDEVTVSLDDLPPTLDGTALSMDDLIARFSVDGRPYADVLRANRERLEQRGHASDHARP